MNKSILVLGDTLAIALLTLIGFATHGETDLSFLPRMAALFFPLSIAWFLLAPPLGLFRRETFSDPRQVWRAGLAAVFAAPLAAVLRGFILNAPVIPIFAAVLAGTSALGLMIWRLISYWLDKRRSDGQRARAIGGGP
ncbi:MAG TPA: DUF3054 family protein [Anaerolineales bacterium]|nr:DUF3054 family protein [Anaerolineales bacterium]